MQSGVPAQLKDLQSVLLERPGSGREGKHSPLWRVLHFANRVYHITHHNRSKCEQIQVNARGQLTHLEHSQNKLTVSGVGGLDDPEVMDFFFSENLFEPKGVNHILKLVVFQVHQES